MTTIYEIQVVSCVLCEKNGTHRDASRLVPVQTVEDGPEDVAYLCEDHYRELYPDSASGQGHSTESEPG